MDMCREMILPSLSELQKRGDAQRESPCHHYKWKSAKGERLSPAGPHRPRESLSCLRVLTQLSELAASEVALNLDSKIKEEGQEGGCGGLRRHLPGAEV